MATLVISADTPAETIPQELLDEALNIADGWYLDRRIDWEDVWDCLDGFELSDGSAVGITTLYGPAIDKIKRYVNQARKAG